MCLAVIGAAFQILPFFVMARIIGKLLSGNRELTGYLIDCAVMAAFWCLRALVHLLSTAQSHKATFAILGSIRKQELAKLSRTALGDVQAKGSGELKNILVERVDSIEPALAHVIPEMSSNAAVVLAALCYLFVLDWRMAPASLIALPLGMVFFLLMMAGYEQNYARTVAATNTLNDTAVEYIGGWHLSGGEKQRISIARAKCFRAVPEKLRVHSVIGDVVAVAVAAAQLRTAVLHAGVVIGTLRHINAPDAAEIALRQTPCSAP